jgi:hypothetical protein
MQMGINYLQRLVDLANLQGNIARIGVQPVELVKMNVV